jgi:phage terminase small subunit
LRKLEIKNEIDKRLETRAKKAGLDAEWVLQRLKDISDRCMQAEAVFDREGNETGEYKFDSTGANKATELIGKHLGMFRDKVEHSGSLGVQIVDDIK